MFSITEYTVERVKDPFGILAGSRYEFILELEVDEEDELYSENGLNLRVVYRVEEARQGVAKYEFLDRSTNHYIDFELEEDEAALVESFCREHYIEGDE
ncbi:DUF6509 family protein [Paenibacillus koleovorans]|uniref:DUF6509 family protein n=1 Tax=Paenibacillus koleovorans TaxID=121608 RepID=UPI000FD7D60A|nr:DUF6509 family protein [Paenibacillus koleovorans]